MMAIYRKCAKCKNSMKNAKEHEKGTCENCENGNGEIDKYAEFIEAGKVNNEELRSLIIKFYGKETWKRARDFTFEKVYIPKNDNCDDEYYEYSLRINWIEDIRNKLKLKQYFKFELVKKL